MDKNSKIYTKTGDKLSTSLYDGSRISKSSDRIEVLGNYDELISFLSLGKIEASDIRLKEEIETIQLYIFKFQADIANPKDEKDFRINEEHIKYMEGLIDYYQANTPSHDGFIVPGTTKTASYLHVARTISRRSERSLVKLAGHSVVNKIHLEFANRLSDLLYMFAYSQEKKLEDPFKDK